jgi:flagellar basal-body rod protein FlgG
MFRAMYTAASGMAAQQINLDAIANNLANSNTTGFRQRQVNFKDLLYQSQIMPGSAATQTTTVAAGIQIGSGTQPSETELIETQGEFTTTGNPTDVAIQGQGLFQILLPSGQIGYTRDGSFHPDAQGQLVTQDGNPLQPAITIPADATAVSIGADGTVTVTQPGQTAATQVGSIQTALFINLNGLDSVGNNIFLATTASGQPVIGTPGGAEGLGALQQGVLEDSNVSVVAQFVAMILAQRSYESNSRVVKAGDEMLQQLNQLSS